MGLNLNERKKSEELRENVKNDMEVLGLSQKDVQFKNKWRRRIKGATGYPGSPGKMAVETECRYLPRERWKGSLLYDSQ